MDFFGAQARQRTLTRRLVCLFILAVALIVLIVNLPLLWMWHTWHIPHGARSNWAHANAGYLKTLLVTSALVIGGIGACSWRRIVMLAEGGPAVARAVGAVAIATDSRDPLLRKLLNVVDEVAIASGVRAPQLYLLESQDSINAFAAGYELEDAAICVTRGCLDHLTRDELQGVVAHEFSHVLNGDMRINIRMMGLLHGIQAMGILGREMLTVDDPETRRGIDPFFFLGLILLGVGYVGVMLGRLIQAAVSRSRESLADASAVQFTRQTAGLCGALKKIAAIDEGSTLNLPNRDAVAHMMFGEVWEAQRWFATHPPVLERIRAMEPGFSATALRLFCERYGQQLEAWREERYVRGDRAILIGEGAREPLREAMPAQTWFSGLNASTMAEPDRDAFPTMASLSASWAQAARVPESAIVMLFALWPDFTGDGDRDRLIATALGDDVLSEVQRQSALLTTLALRHRDQLRELVAQSLPRLPAGRRMTMLQLLDDLARDAGRADMQTFCLLRTLRMRLAPDVEADVVPGKLVDHQHALAQLCAVAASLGRTSEADARRAWQMAMGQALASVEVAWPAMPEAWQSALDAALDVLGRLPEAARELVVQSVTAAAVNGDDETSRAFVRTVSISMRLAQNEVSDTSLA